MSCYLRLTYNFCTFQMRYYFSKVDKTQGFKGSVLVVFQTEEKAKEFMELNIVKFKTIPLIRKWHADYVEEKRKEIEERRAKKEARKNKEENKEEVCSTNLEHSEEINC